MFDFFKKKPKNHNKKYYSLDNCRIRNLLKQGKGIREISEILSRAESGLMAHAKNKELI